MNNTDLRIGNWIEAYPGGFVRVTAIPNEVGNPVTHTPNKIGATHGGILHPIPLTKELLLCNMDFYECSCGGWVGQGFHLDKGRMYNHTVKIDYVHELQNLYFALNRTELKIYL